MHELKVCSINARYTPLIQIHSTWVFFFLFFVFKMKMKKLELRRLGKHTIGKSRGERRVIFSSSGAMRTRCLRRRGSGVRARKPTMKGDAKWEEEEEESEEEEEEEEEEEGGGVRSVLRLTKAMAAAAQHLIQSKWRFSFFLSFSASVYNWK